MLTYTQVGLTGATTAPAACWSLLERLLAIPVAPVIDIDSVIYVML